MAIRVEAWDTVKGWAQPLLANGAILNEEPAPQVTITLTREQLTGLVVRELSLDELREAVEGMRDN